MKHRHMCVLTAVLTASLSIAGCSSSNSPSRAAQVKNDREAIQQAAPVNEFPPVKWTLQPGPGPKIVFPDRLTIEDGNRFLWALSLPGRGPEYLSLEGDASKQELCYGRFDLTTGKQDGPPLKLKDAKGRSFAGSRGYEDVNDDVHLNLYGATTAAVSPTGTLAINLGIGQERLLPIYRPGEDIPKTIPGLNLLNPEKWGRSEPTWFDFAADEKLWVFKYGRLVAWDLSAGKPAFTAQGRYMLPALMGPDRKWLAVQVDDKYLEVLDAATGECRGRLGGEGRWQSIAVSPDGKRLAGARYPGNGFRAGDEVYDFPLDIHEWDLTTGERKAVITLVRKSYIATGLHWLDDNHIQIGEAVVDLKWKMPIPIVRSKPAPGSRAPAVVGNAGRTADGKRWIAVSSGSLINQLVPVKVPLDAVVGEPAFHPGDPVRVEAKCGDSALDTRVAAVLSDALKSYGFRVEDGGWALRVTASASDTGKKMKLSIGEVAVPEVKGTIELVAPDGTVVATSTHRGFAPLGPGSKFYVKTERPQFAGQGGTARYDFGGQSPADAMREEAWTHFVRTLPTSPWPRAAWKSGGKFVPVPLAIEFDPNAKADR
ncbi:MAG: hypothetical protein K8R36_16830 [Planctomycetales bacterium]|nr:hypothetical protein [Planctomycetales bacterium]